MINKKKQYLGLLQQRRSKSKFNIVYESIMNDLGIYKNIKGSKIRNKNINLILEEINKPQYIICKSGKKILLENALSMSQRQLINEGIIDIVKQKVQDLIEWIKDGIEYVIHQSSQTIKAFCQKVKNNVIIKKIISAFNFEPKKVRYLMIDDPDDPIVDLFDDEYQIKPYFSKYNEDEAYKEKKNEKIIDLNDLKELQLQPEEFQQHYLETLKKLKLVTESVQNKGKYIVLKINVQKIKRNIKTFMSETLGKINEQGSKRILIYYVLGILVLLELLIFLPTLLVTLLLSLSASMIILVIANTKFQINKEQIKKVWDTSTEWGKAISNIFINISQTIFNK